MCSSDLARDIGVPRDVWSQVDKRGFGSPVPEWLTTSLAHWCDEQLMYLRTGNAPRLAAIIGGHALSPSSPFDRSRFQAVLISLWWRRNVGHLPRAQGQPFPEKELAEPAR